MSKKAPNFIPDEEKWIASLDSIYRLTWSDCLPQWIRQLRWHRVPSQASPQVQDAKLSCSSKKWLYVGDQHRGGRT